MLFYVGSNQDSHTLFSCPVSLVFLNQERFPATHWYLWRVSSSLLSCRMSCNLNLVDFLLMIRLMLNNFGECTSNHTGRHIVSVHPWSCSVWSLRQLGCARFSLGKASFFLELINNLWGIFWYCVNIHSPEVILASFDVPWLSQLWHWWLQNGDFLCLSFYMY